MLTPGSNLANVSWGFLKKNCGSDSVESQSMGGSERMQFGNHVLGCSNQACIVSLFIEPTYEEDGYIADAVFPKEIVMWRH